MATIIAPAPARLVQYLSLPPSVGKNEREYLMTTYTTLHCTTVHGRQAGERSLPSRKCCARCHATSAHLISPFRGASEGLSRVWENNRRRALHDDDEELTGRRRVTNEWDPQSVPPHFVSPKDSKLTANS